MNPDNPIFRTVEDWAKRCEQLVKELGAITLEHDKLRDLSHDYDRVLVDDRDRLALELKTCKAEYAEYVRGKPGNWYVVELQEDFDKIQNELADTIERFVRFKDYAQYLEAKGRVQFLEIAEAKEYIRNFEHEAETVKEVREECDKARAELAVMREAWDAKHIKLVELQIQLKAMREVLIQASNVGEIKFKSNIFAMQVQEQIRKLLEETAGGESVE